MPTFIGFHSPTTGPATVLYDVDLVKQDLLNHFMTQKGERVMDSDYGFIGWDLMFELKRPGTKELLEQDARRIIATDPRVEIRSFNLTEQENGFTVEIRLLFVVLDTVDVLRINFDQNMIDDQV